MVIPRQGAGVQAVQVHWARRAGTRQPEGESPGSRHRLREHRLEWATRAAGGEAGSLNHEFVARRRNTAIYRSGRHDPGAGGSVWPVPRRSGRRSAELGKPQWGEATGSEAKFELSPSCRHITDRKLPGCV